MAISWQDECVEILKDFKKLDSSNSNEPLAALEKICEVLGKYGFLDSDWWAE